MNNELDLLIEPFEMKVGAEVVYQNDSRQDSFAFKLYNKGIRSLTFKAGLTEVELDSFLKAFIHTTQRKETDKTCLDTVSALWEQEFEHIKYSVADTIVEETNIPGEKSMDQKIDEILDDSMSGYQGTTESSKDDEFYQGINVTITPVSVGKMFQTHTVLNSDDLAKIRHDIAECERPERMLIDFVDMVLAVLMEETEKEPFFTFIEYLGQALENTLIQNQFHLSRILMELLYRFPTKPIPMLPLPIRTPCTTSFESFGSPTACSCSCSGHQRVPGRRFGKHRNDRQHDGRTVGFSELLSTLGTIQDASRKKTVMRGISHRQFGPRRAGISVSR